MIYEAVVQAAAHYQQQQQQEVQQQPQLRAGLRQEGGYHNATANLLVHGLSASRDGYHQSQQFIPNDVYLLDAATGVQTKYEPEMLQKLLTRSCFVLPVMACY